MKLMLNNEIIFGIILILFNSIYLFQALKLPPPFKQDEPGPIFFPLILIVIMYICSTFVLIRGLRGEKKFTLNLNFFIRKPVLAIIFSALYIISFNILGYWISTFFYSFIISIFFENKKRSKKGVIIFSFLVALIITILVWIFFEVLFGLILPRGIW